MGEFSCPRRAEVFGASQSLFNGVKAEEDSWIVRGGKSSCSYCGSLRPEEFLSRVAGGEELTPTDKNYKAYLGSDKFYFQHLSVPTQQEEFVGLFNQRKMTVAHPGYFYVAAYFCGVTVN